MSTMGYVTTLTGAEDAASLSLDFEKQNYRVMEGGKLVSKQFSEFFSFARSTSGGRYNEKGLYESVPAGQPRFDYDPITKALKGLLVEEQRTNLVIYSDNLAALSNVRSTTLRNAALAPDGTYTAAKLVNDSVADWHFIRTNLILASVGGELSASIFAKAGEYPRVRIASGDNTVFNRAAVFDLETGTVVQGGSSGSMTSVGNGWWRCTLSLLGLKVGNAPFTIGAAKAGELETNTAGNGGGLYLWGAQGENGAFPTSHISTEATFTSRASTATYFDKNGVLRTAGVNIARNSAYIYDKSNNIIPVGLLLEPSSTNLIRQSTDLSLSPWSRTQTYCVLSDGGAAPDGTVAQMFTMVGTTGHNITHSLQSALVVGTTYTLSVWLRSPNWGNKQFQLAYYDGGVVQVGAGGSVTLTAEWKRYEYTFTPTTVAAVPQIRLLGYSNGADGDKVEIFGPQLEVGVVATSYIPTAAGFTGRASTATYLDSQGLLQTAASGVARSDTYKYDSSGILRANGLLLEGSGTNLLSNSEDFTSTSWTQGGTGTVPVVVTPAATMGPRGTDTMTSLKRGDLGIRYLSRAFSLPAGNLTFSQYVKATETGKFYCVRIQSGGSGNRVDARFDLVTGAMSTSSIGEVTSPKSFMENMGGGLWRITVSATTTVTWSSLLIVPADRLMTVDSTPVVLSEVFVDCAQVESSPFASSYIPTGATSATRAADVFTSSTVTRAADVSTSVAATRVNDSAPILDMTPWYNQIASSFKVEFTPGPIGVGTTNLAFYTRSSLAIANSLTIVRRGPDVTESTGIITNPLGSVQMTASDKGSVNTGVRIKACISYKLNSAAFATQGKAPILDNTVELPTPDWLFVGNNGSNSQNLNGHIHSLQYYPVRLSDAQTQLITA